MPKFGRRTLAVLFSYVFLTISAAVYLTPIVWVVTTSFKMPIDAFTNPPKLLFTPTLANHMVVWGRGSPFPYFVVNSIVVSLGSALLTLILSVPASYGFVKWGVNKVSLALLVVLLSVRMFPQILMTIPYYVISITLHVYDTQGLLISIYAAFQVPFAIWMLRGFFETLPQHIDEAAMVDGCSRLRALWSVLLPNITGGLAATFFLVFLWGWNEFLFAFILTSTNAVTMPPGITNYFVAQRLEWWSWAAAGVTGYIIPSLIIVIVIRKYLVRGLSFGLVVS